MTRCGITRMICIFYAVFFLLLGLGIYCIVDPNIKMLAVFNFQPIKTENIFLRFLRNYGCDYLWAAALSASLLAVFISDNGLPLISGVCSIVAIIFGFLLEILQKIGLISGVFSIGDITAELIAVLSFWLIINITNKRYERSSKK